MPHDYTIRMLEIHLLKTAQVKDPAIYAKVRTTVKKHGLRAAKALDITSDVNVTVYFNADWTIPSTGENGYTPTADWVQLSVDVTGKTHPVDTVLEKRLPVTVYHELAHVRRWETTGFGSTFIEELISEGLACMFEVEQCEHDIMPLFFASEKEIEKLLTLVRAHKKDLAKNYNYTEWFTKGSKEIPKWLGYKVGYYILTEVKRLHPAHSVPTLIALPAKDILRLSNVKL